MEKQWIEDWREKVGNGWFRLHGCTSTSKNMEVALGFSKCHTDYSGNQQPVLFVFSICNDYGFNGFRMNSKRYSVYPGEQEYLLMEGFKVFALKVEDSFKIKNQYVSLVNDKEE